MGEMKRIIKINKENDDSFVIIQNIVEKINAKELCDIFGKLKSDESQLLRNIESIPKQLEKSLDGAKKNLEMVKTDMEAVGKYAEPLLKKAVEKQREKEEADKANEGTCR